MRVAGYSLDLYCTGRPASEASFHTDTLIGSGYAGFGGNNLRECLKQAKAAGWKTRIDKELCPSCQKIKRVKTKVNP